MLIIGCDYHPGFQQIAFVDSETGELSERRLAHREEAEQFYREMKQQNLWVRVGMESSGHSRWFERLLSDLQFELCIGDAAKIRAKRVRKQKTDRQDAQLILQLLMENRFPQIWVPDAENRDLRQLLWHRHRLVQMRTRMPQCCKCATHPDNVAAVLHDDLQNLGIVFSPVLLHVEIGGEILAFSFIHGRPAFTNVRGVHPK